MSVYFKTVHPSLTETSVEEQSDGVAYLLCKSRQRSGGGNANKKSVPKLSTLIKTVHPSLTETSGAVSRQVATAKFPRGTRYGPLNAATFPS